MLRSFMSGMTAILAGAMLAGTAVANPPAKADAKASAKSSGSVPAKSATNASADSASAASAKAAADAPSPASKAPATAKSSAQEPMVLEGGEDGTVFKSLTVTAEDLVHVEFERPELRLDLDPRKAPGLEWGDAHGMLNESTIDVVKPLLSLSSSEPCPFLGKPWLNGYRTGAVARFQPKMEGVEKWWLTIADSRSDTLAVMEGKGNPKEISWDGRARNGSAVSPGVTCSYVLEALDRAGNRRSFVGPGFVLPAYRVKDTTNEMLLFSGEDLGDSAALASNANPPAILVETASWLNQISPMGGAIQVKVSARSFEEADRLSKAIASALQKRVLGDPSRIRPVADVRADLPARGTVTITAGLTRQAG